MKPDLRSSKPFGDGRPAFYAPSGNSYIKIVKSIFGNSLIGYWPLNELSGDIAHDYSGRKNHGKYYNVSLGQPGIGDCGFSSYFNGNTSYVDVSTGNNVCSSFDSTKGTIMIWLSRDVSFPSSRYPFIIYGNATNFITYNPLSNDTVQLWTKFANANGSVYPGGSIGKNIDVFTHLCLTWDNGLITGMINGLLFGVNRNTGVWNAGVPARVLIGSFDSVPTAAYVGRIAHVVLANRALSLREIRSVGPLALNQIG